MRDLLAEARTYPVTIVPDPHESFVAIIPAFPRIYTNGDTPEQCLANAYEAIALGLDWYYSHDKQPPAPQLPAIAA